MWVVGLWVEGPQKKEIDPKVHEKRGVMKRGIFNQPPVSRFFFIPTFDIFFYEKTDKDADVQSEYRRRMLVRRDRIK